MANIGQLGGQPIFILPEGTLRTTGRDAQSRNIAAAKAVSESVRTTLGPKGMDKMLVDTIGDVTITNDGATILSEMEIEHPAAKMLVEVAKTQEEEVGDGTTTAVVLAGELLKRSEDLLEQEIHPTVILRGYRLAKSKALEILDGLGQHVTINDAKTLAKIAMTAMTGKGSEAAKESLAELAVDAVRMVSETENGKIKINKDDVKIEKKQGGSIDDTELVKGLVIDKEIVHSNMPKKIKDAKIALLDAALEVKETETNAEIRITSPDQLQAFLDQESKMLKDMTRKVVASGCNVLFCQKGIDDLAQHYLAKEKIAAVRRVKKSDMEKMAKATGGSIVSSVDELTPKDLGEAGLVEELKLAGEEMIFVRDCKNPKAVSILVRGGTEHVVDEVKRAMDDAVLGVMSALEVGKVVPGGGAIEIELARRLREYAETVGGREQLAINAFAEAVEIIPRTLAESTGKDPIDILVELRTLHEKGKKAYGVDVINGTAADMETLNVIEPLKIKTQAIKSATEAAEMILRIDDIITAKSGGGGMPGGMPPGAGGMGGMNGMEE
ncbi:MAG: TCP-1/cpn60 chaperonin family protein [Candidatus Aenigmarchaeota archaeon]|nr:TCP-1/cpn60 chaperonin family protein [Candidatus Aenigmarchaeota archaeon]